MPTRIAILGRERTIATLARRIFTIEGPDKAERQRRAEAALLRANPRLATAEGFRSGAAIVVPVVAGLEVSDQSIRARAEPAGIAAETKARLQAGASRIEEKFQRAEAELGKRVGELNDRQFRVTLRRTLPDAEPLFAAATESLRRRQAENADASKNFQQAIDTAMQALDALQAQAAKARR